MNLHRLARRLLAVLIPLAVIRLMIVERATALPPASASRNQRTESANKLPVPTPSVFLHIGPNTDPYPLIVLDRGEVRILYVEPLTLQINAGRINAFKAAHKDELNDVNVQQQFDKLFECGNERSTTVDSECRRAVTSDDVHEYAKTLVKRIERAASITCSAASEPLSRNKSAAADALTPPRATRSPTGLAGFRLLRAPVIAVPAASDASPTVTIDFMSDGVSRQLVVLVAPIAAVDWARALVGADGERLPVSTLVHTGVSNHNSQLGADAVCDVARPERRAQSGIRAIRQLEGDPVLRCAGQRPASSRVVRFRCPSAAEDTICRQYDACSEPMVVDSWR